MATLLKAAYDGYIYILDEYSDPRTKDWMLMGGLVPIVTILFVYNYFCSSVGPRWMKDRQPFDLKYVLIVYNAVQVVFNAWLFNEALQGGWLRDYNYKCQPADYSDNPVALRMAEACWWYLFCKVVDLLDTVFFVLRKKNNQISYLHLWHHSSMIPFSWTVVKYGPGGHGSMVFFINSFVHIIMYSYYLLTAFGPSVRKYLWWKKYLTTLQMVQLIIVFLHMSQLLIYDCDYPKIVVYQAIANAVYLLYLFGGFYGKAYLSKKNV